MDVKGKGSGLSLIIVLLVTLIIAFLASKNMNALGWGSVSQQEQVQQNPVEKTQEAVDAVNERMQNTVIQAEP